MFLRSLTFSLLLAYLCKGTEDLHLDGARIHKIFPNIRETILDPPFTRGIFHTPRPLLFEFGTPIQKSGARLCSHLSQGLNCSYPALPLKQTVDVDLKKALERIPRLSLSLLAPSDHSELWRRTTNTRRCDRLTTPTVHQSSLNSPAFTAPSCMNY